jgi:hypothetical protein
MMEISLGNVGKTVRAVRTCRRTMQNALDEAWAGQRSLAHGGSTVGTAKYSALRKKIIIIFISSLIFPLLEHRPFLWITHKKKKNFKWRNNNILDTHAFDYLVESNGKDSGIDSR